LSKLRRKENIEGWIGISPWLIGFILFQLIPIGMSLYMSFTDWHITRGASWIGLENYKNMFHTQDFWISLRVTTLYSIMAVPLYLVAGLILSLLLNVNTRWSHFFRTMYYMPSVISGVASAILWIWLFNPEFGLINYFLRLLGIKGPRWLFDEKWALPAIVLMGLWGIGGNAIIYLAGLRNIPSVLYEAAEIDGANPIQCFFKITLPLLTPTIFFVLVTGIIGSFQVFTQAYLMTNGGPNKATLFYILYLYNEAFRGQRMGYGSALAWFLALIILTLTLLVFKSSPLWVYYEGERRGEAR
jgi:multiple sugar transport system permease protein